MPHRRRKHYAEKINKTERNCEKWEKENNSFLEKFLGYKPRDYKMLTTNREEANERATTA